MKRWGTTTIAFTFATTGIGNARLPLYCGFVDIDGEGETLFNELDGVDEALFMLVRKELFERLREIANCLLEGFLGKRWLKIEQAQVPPKKGMLTKHCRSCNLSLVTHGAPLGQR